MADGSNGLWGVILGGVLTAGAAVAGSAVTYWNTDRGHDIDMVRISLSILGGENEDTSIYGRRFALRALEQYADIDIPDDEFENWARSGTIPDAEWIGTSYYAPGWFGGMQSGRTTAESRTFFREFLDAFNSADSNSDNTVSHDASEAGEE